MTKVKNKNKGVLGHFIITFNKQTSVTGAQQRPWPGEDFSFFFFFKKGIIFIVTIGNKIKCSDLYIPGVKIIKPKEKAYCIRHKAFE